MADEPVTVLPEEECWSRLESASLGRLVTSVGGEPEIFPVNFVVQDRTVLFRTGEGTKLFVAVTSGKVAFEADSYDVAEGWSVIVKGQAQVLKTDDEIRDAERAELFPWTATQKDHYIRVAPSEITGRHFNFGPQPDSYLPFG